MRSFQILAILTALTAQLHAQDVVVMLGTSATPTIVETRVSGTTVGTVESITPLPDHHISNYRPELIVVAGSRHVVWTAAFTEGFGRCHELIALFDRRTRTARDVPGTDSWCNRTKLAGDPWRPRVFVHRRSGLGDPGQVAIVDDSLTYQPLVTADWIGTAFAYAPDVNRFFVTRGGIPSEPGVSIGVFDGFTGAEVASFPLPNAPSGVAQFDLTRLLVSSDGRRLYLYGYVSQDANDQIRSFDVATGQEIAAANVDVTYYPSAMVVLDEPRNMILVPNLTKEAGYVRELLALDAETLTPLGVGNPEGYRDVYLLQVMRARGNAGAYALTSDRNSESGVCDLWLDTMDLSGVRRAHVNFAQIAGFTASVSSTICPAVAAVLSAPNAPSSFVANVRDRQLALTWIDPGNTSEFEIEGGFASGTRAFAVQVGRVTDFSADNVPAGDYYLRVRAINEIGTSPASNEVRVTVP